MGVSVNKFRHSFYKVTKIDTWTIRLQPCSLCDFFVNFSSTGSNYTFVNFVKYLTRK